MIESAETASEMARVSDVMSVARESIVLVTVLVGAGIAYFLWVKVLKPFMDQQREITTAVANALNAIQTTSASQAQIAAAQANQAEHLRDSSENIAQAAKSVESMRMRLVQG